MGTVQAFHLFPRLPYDLRHRIYVLASPPRVVPVEEIVLDQDDDTDVDDPEGEYWNLEDEDIAYSKFKKTLESGPLPANLRLHPDLTYFVDNWRRRIPWHDIKRTQTRLEDYGFTTKTKQTVYEPWIATPDVPHIPIDWLTHCPEAAFELARSSWFYSNSPIPAFLHVCTESRNALTRWGYQLAFGTRSHAPRIWFHFERDLLSVPCHFKLVEAAVDYSTILSGCRWNVGQFDVHSLRSVRRLVLTCASLAQQNLHDLASITMLFPNLKELLLEDWSTLDLMGCLFDLPMSVPDEYDPCWFRRQRTPIVCIPWEPIDTFGCMCWFESRLESMQQADLAAELSITFTPTPSIGGRLLQPHRDVVAQNLSAAIAALVDQNGLRHVTLLTIRFVHICPEALSGRFLLGRHQFWQDFTHLQEKQRSGLPLVFSHRAVKELRFAVNLESIERKTKLCCHSQYPGVGIIGLLEEIKRFSTDESVLVRWLFEGPTIPEPSLCLV